jgi:hypothetical protein
MSIDNWIGGADQTFAFMLALPFLVGLAGLLAEYLGRRWATAERAGEKSCITPRPGSSRRMRIADDPRPPRVQAA